MSNNSPHGTTLSSLQEENRKVIILIADDEPEILEYLQAELKANNENFSIKIACSGYKALNYIQSNHIDLLLTDIAMPDMDGYDLYSRVREIRPNLPIIMMTGFGYDPKHSLIKAKEDGLEMIFYKHFDVKKLFDMINDSLRKK